MKSLLIFGLLLSFSVFAKTTCKVKDEKTALECIKKDAYTRYTKGEMDHTVGVTQENEGTYAFKAITGEKVAEGSYAGVVEVHYDEDQLLYYTVKKGRKVSPKLVKSFNLPDLLDEYDLENNDEVDLYNHLSLYIELEDFHID